MSALRSRLSAFGFDYTTVLPRRTAKAESLAHQRVVVKGRVERVAQAAVPKRMIIRVIKLDA